MLREIGALDNSTYRQVSGVSVAKASSDLKKLCYMGLLISKGKSRGVYYLPSDQFTSACGAKQSEELKFVTSIPDNEASIPDNGVSIPDKGVSIPDNETSIPDNEASIPDKGVSIPDSMAIDLLQSLPIKLQYQITNLKKRTSPDEVKQIILDMCAERAFSAYELSLLLKRGDKYIQDQYLKRLLDLGLLEYSYPDMPRHPKQSYKTVIK
ncbi:hypothetical protein [Porphyromonas levii]|uniref:hypothetical protein n=1 Tax=Porphyromonas levii TaxID=28114 RepID=UPI001BA90964|nr:hypothetical protein [Porphyromonas levii]